MAIKNKGHRSLILTEKTRRVEENADFKIKVEIISPQRA
jgi:hypothetical protein